MPLLRASAILLFFAALGVIGAVAFATLPAPRDNAIHEQGIGPLALGQEYTAAVALARRATADIVVDGPGCDGRDQITYRTTLAGMPAAIMAMADEARLSSIEALLSTPRRAADEAACIDLRDRFGQVFKERFGAADHDRLSIRPVSRGHRVDVGPVVLHAHWFPGDRTCYVGALYQVD